MRRHTTLAAALCSLLFLPATALADEEASGFDFWSPHYAVDYGLTAAGLMVEFFHHGEPNENALIGPSFDPESPQTILSPEYSAALGGPFVPEEDWTVPSEWLMLAAAGQLVFVSANEYLAADVRGGGVTAHRMHHSLLAVMQATAVNAGLTRLVKSWVGRLRPDFQARARYVYCSLPDSEGIDCEGLDPELLYHDPEEALDALEEGRFSFWSGHSSNGMVIATNLALQTGGLWVWGEGATPTSRALGIGAMAGLGALGAFSAISRTDLVDGVHHDSDVVVGSLVGIGLANLFYWLHFDSSGRPRERHWLNRGAQAGGGTAVADLRLSFTGPGIALSGRW